MIRRKVFGCVLVLIGLALACESPVDAGGNKSDSKVKATAEASKIDAKRTQNVTITLKIDKGWHLYANPVNHEFLEGAETKVKIASKGKLAKVSVKYPAGKTVIDKKEKYDVYEDVVKINATILRAAGDTSPLEISVAVQACDSKVCLQPATIKLTTK